jgi:uncharacterized protein (TIGR03437 family)
MNSLRFLIILLASAALAFGYAEGPDAGLAGVPGEATCSACHSGGSGSGNVTVAFANGLSYSPGVKQHLIVTITDSAQRRWGFELTARRSSNTKTQAGTFTPGSDGYTQIVCTQTTFQTENFGSCPASMPLQYIEHTLKGTRNGTKSPVTFEFDWTPPATNVGSINIYVAANAANGDGNITGDHIYTAHYSLNVAAQVNPPTISQVVNGASYQPSIAPNTWVTIQGTNLANSTRPWNSSDFVNGSLPTQLDGVSVTIDGTPAYVEYIDPQQINVLAPADNASGPVAVQVNNNGVSSTPSSVELDNASPALFLWSGKYAVTTRQDGSWVGPPNLFAGATTTPAAPGDVVILWSTGLGSTSPATPAGQQVPATQVYATATAPVVTIGGIQANVIGAALSPGSAGLYQIAVAVPAGVPTGDQPVAIQVNGLQSAGTAYLSVQD